MRFYGLPQPENLNVAARITFNNMKRLVSLGIALAACALCLVVVKTLPVKKREAAGLMKDNLDAAVRAEQSRDHKSAVGSLGESLHTTQDKSAHADQNAGWIAHANGSKPDSTTEHPDNALNANKNTRDLLDEFNRRTGKADE